MRKKIYPEISFEHYMDADNKSTHIVACTVLRKCVEGVWYVYEVTKKHVFGKDFDEGDYDVSVINLLDATHVEAYMVLLFDGGLGGGFIPDGWKKCPVQMSEEERLSSSEDASRYLLEYGKSKGQDKKRIQIDLPEGVHSALKEVAEDRGYKLKPFIEVLLRDHALFAVE